MPWKWGGGGKGGVRGKVFLRLCGGFLLLFVVPLLQAAGGSVGARSCPLFFGLAEAAPASHIGEGGSCASGGRMALAEYLAYLAACLSARFFGSDDHDGASTRP